MGGVNPPIKKEKMYTLEPFIDYHDNDRVFISLYPIEVEIVVTDKLEDNTEMVWCKRVLDGETYGGLIHLRKVFETKDEAYDYINKCPLSLLAGNRVLSSTSQL